MARKIGNNRYLDVIKSVDVVAGEFLDTVQGKSNLGLRSVSERFVADVRQSRVCKMNEIQRVSTKFRPVPSAERSGWEE